VLSLRQMARLYDVPKTCGMSHRLTDVDGESPFHTEYNTAFE